MTITSSETTISEAALRRTTSVESSSGRSCLRPTESPTPAPPPSSSWPGPATSSAPATSISSWATRSADRRRPRSTSRATPTSTSTSCEVKDSRVVALVRSDDGTFHFARVGMDHRSAWV